MFTIFFLVDYEYFQPLITNACICANCFALLNKIQKFSDRCNKAQQLLTFLANISGSVDLESVRNQFGLEKDEKADRSTDTIDLPLDIKDEFNPRSISISM